MLYALLIDDEVTARADLREKLLSHRGVAVVGEAGTLLTARALLASADYDLVFLDVQLIGGESFDLVPFVRPGASIVFATAHERYALRAFESHAVDYLLKPIDSARLAEALRRAAGILERGGGSLPTAAERDAPRQPATPPAPFAFQGRCPVSENFFEVALTAHERDFLRQCLEAWEDSLPPTHALRAHRDKTAPFPRAVRYERDTEPTRLFLADAPGSRARRCWRALRTRLGW